MINRNPVLQKKLEAIKQRREAQAKKLKEAEQAVLKQIKEAEKKELKKNEKLLAEIGLLVVKNSAKLSIVLPTEVTEKIESYLTAVNQKPVEEVKENTIELTDENIETALNKIEANANA